MTNAREIKPGYKPSPLGPIPNDWEVRDLKEICLKIQDGNYGGDYPTSDEFVESGIPFLTSKAIGGEGEILEHKIDFISIEKHSKLKKAQLKLNDVLFTNRGANVGTIGLVDERIAHGNIGPQLTLLRSDESKVTHLFLKEAMKSFIVQNQVRSQDSGSAMNFFGIGDTSKFKLLLPELHEQTAIANLLSTWDRAITHTTQLIAQKELRKKWIMQQLLTGKKRLKGFSKNNDFHNLGGYIKEVSKRNKELQNTKVLSVTNSRGFINQSEQFDRVVASDDASNYKIIRKGQFAYNPSRVNVGSLDLLRNFKLEF
jgi:type I restriction enzyme, S subunit